MRIVVLVKHAPDPEEPVELDPEDFTVLREDGVLSEIDSRALAVAQRLRADGDEVLAMTMGPEDANPSLRKALAAGADRAVHIVDDALAGADALTTVRVLAAALRAEGFDLVLTGDASTDGHGGVVPAMLAESLSLPHVTHLSELELADGAIQGARADGRRTRVVRAPLPAIASVTEQAAEPTIPNFAGLKSARTKPVAEVDAAELGTDQPRAGAWTVVSAEGAARRERGEILDGDDDAVARLADFILSTRAMGA